MDFEEYVAARGRALERYAYLLTGDLHRSQDLVQTALVEALVRWRRISRVDHPDAYVRRIVTTRHLDWHRLRSSREESLDQAVDDGRVDVADAGAAPDHAAGVVDRQQILEALATLTKPQRAVVALRYYEGYDDAAIAAVLGARRAGYTASRRSLPLNRRPPGAAAWRSRTLSGQVGRAVWCGPLHCVPGSLPR